MINMVAAIERGVVLETINGLQIRLNPEPAVADLPDEEVYQIVTPSGQLYSGNKDTIYKLVNNEAWVKRFGQ